jgi:ligand-binding sensor domain-containing protein
LFNHSVLPSTGASKNLSDYILCADSQSLWLISISGGGIYRKNDVELVPFASKKLKSILATRKVTSVAHFKGRLFITTYSGLVVYDTYHDELEVWYEKEIFSSALIDNEHNVWLTTLRNGIYFVFALAVLLKLGSQQSFIYFQF